MNLDKRYSDIYRNESITDNVIEIKAWPKNRHEAAIYFSGSGDKLLDIGCGNGNLLFNLRAKYKKLYGVEVSSHRAKIAAELLKDYKSKIFKANIENGIPLERNVIDLVICSDVIEHIVDLHAAFCEINRMLKPGGRLMIITPNIAYFKRRLQLLFGKFPYTSWIGGDKNIIKEKLFDGGHLHYFTFNMLEKLYRKYGFINIKKYGFGKLKRIHNYFSSILSPACMLIGEKK